MMRQGHGSLSMVWYNYCGRKKRSEVVRVGVKTAYQIAEILEFGGTICIFFGGCIKFDLMKLRMEKWIGAFNFVTVMSDTAKKV